MCLCATTLCAEAILECKLVNTLTVLSITAGIYTMVVVSIERVRCVLPARGHDVPTPGTRSIGIRGTIIAIAMVWMLSVIVAVPTGFNFDVGVVDDTVVCHSTWTSLQTSIYSLFLLVVSYLLPQAVLYVNYGRLAAYLWRRSRAIAAARTQPQPQSVNADSQTVTQRGTSGATPTAINTVRTIMMLATIAIMFLAAWAPYFTIMTIEVICIFL